MRINSAARSLSLALQSLDDTVAPDATSDAARNAISNIRLTLTDLLKREGPGRDFLRECIVEGLTLCQQILHLLGSNDSTLPTLASNSTNQCYESLVEIHGDLTERMNQLLAQLLTAVPNNQQIKSILRKAAEWEQRYYVGLPAIPVSPLGKDPEETSKTNQPLTATSLQQFLRARWLWEFDILLLLQNNSGEEEIVVRKSDNVTISLDLEQEFRLVSLLRKMGVPVPQPFEYGSDLPCVDGSFYTMSRLPGRTVSSYVDGAKKKIDAALLLKLAEILGKLHSIPLERFSDYLSSYGDESVIHESIEGRNRRKLEYWQKYSQEVYHPASPYVTWLFDWLRDNVPEDIRRPVLSHGDFNVHNVLADGSDVSGILDWETADFGAPEMDLSYIQHTVSAHMDWEVFLETYYKHGGQKINPPSMLYCSVYTGLRLALAAGRFTASLQGGKSRDIRFINVEKNLTAAIMTMGLTVTKASWDLRSKAKEEIVCAEPVKQASSSAEAVHI